MSIRSSFKLRRRRFPTKIAFAVTVNKAQGQKLKRAGIYLPLPVFPLASSIWHFPDPLNFAASRVQFLKAIDNACKKVN
jgi:hypothetical protein